MYDNIEEIFNDVCVFDNNNIIIFYSEWYMNIIMIICCNINFKRITLYISIILDQYYFKNITSFSRNKAIDLARKI